MMKEKPDSAEDTPFIRTISELCSGDVSREASEEMEALVRACMQTGKKGSLTLTLEVKPTGVAKCAVSADLKTKSPKDDFPVQAMFATERGQLLRENPEQRLLPFKEVERKKDVKEATRN